MDIVLYTGGGEKNPKEDRMKKIEIDLQNGIKEIDEFDDDVMFENNTSLDVDYLENWLKEFKAEYPVQWLITDEQFEALKESYGIEEL